MTPSRDSRPPVAVLGGTGFIGRSLVAALRADGRDVRMLTRGDTARAAAQTEAKTAAVADAPPLAARHHQPPVHAVAVQGGSSPRGAANGDDADRCDAAIVQVRGDMRDPAALARLIVPGCTLINLAWTGVGVTASDAAAQARLLGEACIAGGARLLLHGSSVSVMGGCTGARIDDETPARPGTTDAGYGAAKLAGEAALRASLAGRVPLDIVRPTEVFGPGGAGLMRLAHALTARSRGARIRNYLRSCLFGRRRLHLVPVETVVAALIFLEARELATPSGSAREAGIYLVSADAESPQGFREVERRLMPALGVADHALPRVPLPAAALRAALWSAGRRTSLPFTQVDARRLRELDFRPPVALGAALTAFGEWFRLHHVTR